MAEPVHHLGIDTLPTHEPSNWIRGVECIQEFQDSISWGLDMGPLLYIHSHVHYCPFSFLLSLVARFSTPSRPQWPCESQGLNWCWQRLYWLSYFHSMLPCSPKRMKDWGEREPGWTSGGGRAEESSLWEGDSGLFRHRWGRAQRKESKKMDETQGFTHTHAHTPEREKMWGVCAVSSLSLQFIRRSGFHFKHERRYKSVNQYKKR